MKITKDNLESFKQYMKDGKIKFEEDGVVDFLMEDEEIEKFVESFDVKGQTIEEKLTYIIEKFLSLAIGNIDKNKTEGNKGIF